MSVCPMCAGCGAVFPSIEAMVRHVCPVQHKRPTRTEREAVQFERESQATGV